MNNPITVGSSTEISESNFISKVFLWMALGLAVSAGASLWLLSQPELFKTIVSNRVIFFGLFVVELGLVFWLSAAALRMSAALATALFFGYSFLNGVTLAPIFVVYTGSSIASTFAVAAGTFFFFSLYGLTTKKDLTSIGSLAIMALFGIILTSLVNLFLKNSTLNWILNFIGIAVFLGLIAYDTQKLKAIHAAGFQEAEMRKKMTILGALALYLDFINLFLLLLQFFGKRRD